MTVTPVVLDQLPTSRDSPTNGTSSTGGAASSRRLGSVTWQVLKRLAGSLAVVLSVLTATFLITRVFAPDPTSLFLGSAGNGYANAQAQAEARAKVRADLGLDTSLPQQYVHFLNRTVHGDLGVSFQTGRSVTADLQSRLPATAELAVYALIFGVSLGIAVGVISAVRRDGLFDRVARFAIVGSLALPQFWIGLMLLWLFYTTLHLAPGPIGRLPLGSTPPQSITGFYVIDGLLSGNWSTTWDAIRQLILPVLTLGLGLAGVIAKVVRTSMVEALTSDYVRTAKALGFGRRRIWLVYALKNGLLPVVTLLAGIIGYTFSGSILVEGVFGWPGAGNYSLQGIQTSDFPAIQGFVVYGAVLYVVIYELLNVAYRIVDPRARA
jgi:ABC-type dipeptide/oligopeptide/nickel transport system permease component